MLENLLAAQVAVEGAQAGDLSLKRGRGDGGLALAPGGQLGHERGEVRGADIERVDATAVEELTELLKIGAVRLERVPGETALELEVGEEVERQFGQASRGSDRVGGGHDMAYSGCAGVILREAGARGAHVPPLAPPDSPGRRKPEQGDQRLGVLALRDRVVELVQRPRHDLDSLILLRLGRLVGVGDLRGEVQPYSLVAEPGAREEHEQLVPMTGTLADLLGELALGGRQRRFAGHVELARRESPATRPRRPPHGAGASATHDAHRRRGRRRRPDARPSRG